VYETNGNKGGEAIVQQGWSATIPDREVLLQGKRLQRRQRPKLTNKIILTVKRI